MKKVRIKIILGGLFAVLVTSSCKKQLDIPSRNQIDASIALSNKAGIENSLNSVYAVLKGLRHYGRDMFAVPEAMADVAFANGRSSRLLGENRNQSGSNLAHWASSYGAINEINLTLAAIPNIADATAADKTRWEGEFRFLRALYYFDLVKSYAYIPTYVVGTQNKGGVVINLQGFSTPDAAVAFRPSRATIDECYAQIMDDLYKSIALLSNSNRGRNYASKHAALALGSRVALYEGRWARADSFATAAITLTGGIGALTNTGNYVSGWRAADHPEGIFQIWYATVNENQGQNEALSATHTTLSTPGGFAGQRSGQGDLVPNAFLLTQLGISGFPPNLSASSCLAITCNPIVNPPTLTYSNDVRNKLFEWGVNASGHYVEVTKWMGKNGSAHWDNTVVLRWAELYLNRAEARFNMANEAGAWADLNVIRLARYTGFVVPGAQDFTGQALLDEILRQRMLEFAFEGHRFFDLKRYGLTITKTNPSVTLPATDFKILPRIPQGEVDGNPNMVQNFGY